jgi:mRNA deadenylase 3'-5' endonuclease subunit Ccr4
MCVLSTHSGSLYFTTQWEHRRSLIIAEITRHRPDIVTLQEVDHFEFFEGALSAEGFSGMYQPATNHSPIGVAFFYRTSK